jgi:hypothetical protein
MPFLFWAIKLSGFKLALEGSELSFFKGRYNYKCDLQDILNIYVIYITICVLYHAVIYMVYVYLLSTGQPIQRSGFRLLQFVLSDFAYAG